MNDFRLTTPVALMIFNRPETTARVFEAIREAKPQKLLVIADGPRAGRESEARQCALTRAIINRVDWPCEVLTNYSETNLGCKRRISSGLDWVFATVAEAIILEDDCLPERTFFRFCQELLERYRDDERIMHISGNNFQFGRNKTDFSYYFSRYPHIWGWASWRRAWQNYDVSLKLWPEIREGKRLCAHLGSNRAYSYWERIFDKVYRGEIDTWDYQWTFVCWIQNGLSILPSDNLVSNIGFGLNSTHTGKPNKLAAMPTRPMEFPLKRPSFMMRNDPADQDTQADQFDNSLIRKIRNKIINM